MAVRISLIGNSGSGKSTFAKVLGAALNVPIYHLDRYLMTGNYQKLPNEHYWQVHNDLIAQENWIIDGNYRSAQPERIKRSTLVIFLDVSRFVSVPRLLWRVRHNGQPADTVPDGARKEQMSWELLRWTLGFSRRRRIRQLRKACREAGVPFLILKSEDLPSMLAKTEQFMMDKTSSS